MLENLTSKMSNSAQVSIRQIYRLFLDNGRICFFTLESQIVCLIFLGQKMKNTDIVRAGRQGYIFLKRNQPGLKNIFTKNA